MRMMQPIRREELLVNKTFRPFQPDRMRPIQAAWLSANYLACFIFNVADRPDLGQIPSRY